MSRGDVVDRAAEREEQLRQDALAAQQRRAAADCALGAAPTRCLDCGTKLPIKRMRAVPGCKRCVDCQDVLDLVRKRR